MGDWIRSPDRDIEGLLNHWVGGLPLSGRLTSVPSISQTQPSYLSLLRIHHECRIVVFMRLSVFGMTMLNRSVQIGEQVKSMLEQHPDIDNSQTLMVNFNQFEPSSLDFFIYCFTKTTVWAEYHTVKEDVLLKAYDLITGLGAEVAFPTQTLHLQVEPEVLPAESVRQR